MRVYSYVVAVDSGFAPNPFWGALTLACCKPKIRLKAKPGDVVVGLTPAGLGSRVVYVALINERLSVSDYWNDVRFLSKRPDMDAPTMVRCQGDNIYEPEPLGGFRQRRSRHSDGHQENPDSKRTDLGGRYVVTAREFSYFGENAILLPESLRGLIAGRGHRCNFPPEIVADVSAWRTSLPRGVHGRPYRWRDEDASWQEDR